MLIGCYNRGRNDNMIEKLKPITEDKPNYLSNSEMIIGVIRTIRNPNTEEIMSKINEIIEVVNNIKQ